MTSDKIAGIVISTLVAAAFMALAVIMFCGKGGRYLPFYRYEPKVPEAQKYHLKLLRILAGFVFATVAMVYIGIMCIIFEVGGNTQTVGGVIMGVGLLFAIAGVLFMSINESMLLIKRKARDDYWDRRFHEEGEEELRQEFLRDIPKKRRTSTKKKSTGTTKKQNKP